MPPPPFGAAMPGTTSNVEAACGAAPADVDAVDAAPPRRGVAAVARGRDVEVAAERFSPPQTLLVAGCAMTGSGGDGVGSVGERESVQRAVVGDGVDAAVRLVDRPARR